MRGARLALLALWLLSTALWLTPGLVIPDGAGYFVYLPSSLLGRDLVFFDEWQRIGAIRDGVVRFKEITPTGHLGNHWPAGSALAWAPGFLAGHLIAPATGFRADGWSLPYNVASSAVSALAGLAVLLGCWRIAMRWTTPWRAAAACAAGWLGTNLLWYSLVNALTAHVISAAAAVAVVVLSLRLRERCDAMGMVATGIAGGFACAVRPQNLVLAVVPFLVAGSKETKGPLARGFAWYALGGVLGASPQLLVSWVLYGHPLGFTHLGDPSAASPFASFDRFFWWEPLFSWYHGLFTWTPLALVAILGWRDLRRLDRRLASASIWVFAAFWAMNASMERSFWGGFAFGQRKFDAVLPFLLLGVGALVAARPRLAALLLVPCCLWTTLLMFASRRLDLNAYQDGAELMRAALAALASAPRHFALLGAVPSGAQGTVAVVALLALMALALLALALRRLPARAALAAAVLYLLAADAWILAVSRNDAAAIAGWSATIERNRGGEGALAMRLDLLRREAAYLRKSGRRAEALRTEGEARELAGGPANRRSVD